MKKTLFASIAVFAIGVLSISQITMGGQIVDNTQIGELHRGVSLLQEEVPAPPQEITPPAPATAVPQDQSPSDVAPAQEPGSVLNGPVVTGEWVETPFMPMAPVAPPVQCNRCCCAPCCCPIATDLCLVDDCGCSYDICVNLPPCCVGEAPVVSWRKGILGRKIANLCWTCCNKRVKVVIPVVGGPRVWE